MHRAFGIRGLVVILSGVGGLCRALPHAKHSRLHGVILAVLSQLVGIPVVFEVLRDLDDGIVVLPVELLELSPPLVGEGGHLVDLLLEVGTGHQRLHQFQIRIIII